MEKRKPGRPPTQNARTIQKSLTMTPAEKKMLEETAEMYGLSQNATVIQAVFEMHQRANSNTRTGKYSKAKEQPANANAGE